VYNIVGLFSKVVLLIFGGFRPNFISCVTNDNSVIYTDDHEACSNGRRFAEKSLPWLLDKVALILDRIKPNV